MSSLQEISPHAEQVISQQMALQVNATAAVGLMDVLKTNLGPTGTLKLLVGGAGQLKLTKDGLTLLKEMQIQHPTAALIARTATAQDDVTGDGTTSTVLLTGELLRQAQQLCSSTGSNLHPRIITDGFDVARDACLAFLKDSSCSVKIGKPEPIDDTDPLLHIAQCSLGTKLDDSVVQVLAPQVVKSVQIIHEAGMPIDTNRVEVLSMQRRSALDTRLVPGLVLDHGARHPDMPSELHNCFILTCNVSLEYEQTETQAGFVYSTAEEREALVESERKWLDQRCRQIVELKRQVQAEKKDATFVIINQKGVDPLSLDIFAKEGILCLRRAKRRNMERLILACGGSIVLSLEDLSPDVLGRAGKVHQVSYGEDKFTFVEDCPNAKSCTFVLQGPNELTTQQMNDALKDGLRAVKNAVEDGAVVGGGGAFEIAVYEHIMSKIVPTIKDKRKLGVQAFANALLVIPKTLAANAGHDVQDVVLKLQEEHRDSGMPVGLDVRSGEAMLSLEEGVLDNVRVKRQSLYLATVLANQLLLVDEVMKAGKQMGKPPPGPDGDMI